MKILLVPKQNDLCIGAAQKLEDALKRKKQEIIYDATTGDKLGKVSEKIEDFTGDIVITLGGDGTFLYAAPKTTKPILPVRIEGFGFLTTIDFEELIKKEEPLKDLIIIEKPRLQIEGIGAPPAVNEIMLVREIPSKIINIGFSINRTEFSFRGDGVIFATPSGSTAYALSAGGSVIENSIDAIEIVPIFPFNSKFRPMVIPASHTIELYVESGLIIVDGAWEKKIENKRLKISKGRPVRVAAFGEDFYEKYKEKFLA